ncbi:MAG TPA: D-aminoacyl-tRNA deacylase [Gemmatimonadota bacterium]|nr:D-aminoacyl-tRNA deacylase [Gemmatimonadota bacterium]
MRALVQRVSEAAVIAVDGQGAERETGRIGRGLLALVAFAPGDLSEALAGMAAKIIDLRLFPGPDGEFDQSLRELEGELLVVSQFTLYADATKGRRPDFANAASYGQAEHLYEIFCEHCQVEIPGRVATGDFGARMRVQLVNDGPVTLWLER